MRRVNELAPILRARHGGPVRKVCLGLGATCPNRDGRLGRGGCLFCAEPEELPLPPLDLQIQRGLARLPPGAKIIAYLQDHSATYIGAEILARALAALRAHPEVVSVAIGTRPDCLPDEILALLEEHVQASGQELMVELGLQTVRPETLRFNRRLHSVSCFDQAVARLHGVGARVCAHVVLGLPTPPGADGRCLAEGRDAATEAARHLGRLGVDAVKVHHCHVLRGSGLERLYGQGRYEPPDLSGYLDRLSGFLLHLPATVEVHRLMGESPAARLVAPAFTADKAATLQRIRRQLDAAGLVQGARWDAHGSLTAVDISESEPL